jgi:hypothetical protein
MGTYQLRGPLAPQTYSVLPRSSHDMRVQRCYIILHPTPRACYCGLGRQVGVRARGFRLSAVINFVSGSIPPVFHNVLLAPSPFSRCG